MRVARNLLWSSVIGVSATAFVIGCERELTLEPAVDLSKVVEAQFDPTSPIPVLQIVPSPTGLAQNPNGPGLTVVAQPCELPTTKQCLQFAAGWPTNTPITLYFSGALDETTVKAGVKLLEQSATGVENVDYQFTTLDPRPPPPEACQDGNNGSDPPQRYSASDVPPGIALVLTPSRPLTPSTSYVILVESSADAGLKAATGDRVEASSLFALMNVDTEGGANPAPIEADGTINAPILRSQIQGLVIAGLYPGRAINELSAEEREAVDAGVAEQARARLFPLYGFFDQIIAPLAQANVTSRDRLVLANAWTTAPAPAATNIEFDPATGKFPFPNVPLMTATTGAGLGDVQVRLPVPPVCDAMGRPAGCESGSSVQLKRDLNELTGFSTTAPITVGVTGDIDGTALSDHVVVVMLGDDGKAIGAPIAVIAEAVATTTLAPPAIQITPRAPLKQNATYAVGLKRGILDTNGEPIGGSSTFDLLKTPVPLIDGNGKVTVETVRQALECSTLTSSAAELANEAFVNATAAALENDLQRARWQAAFMGLESLDPPVGRGSLQLHPAARANLPTHINPPGRRVRPTLRPGVSRRVRANENLGEAGLRGSDPEHPGYKIVRRPRAPGVAIASAGEILRPGAQMQVDHRFPSVEHLIGKAVIHARRLEGAGKVKALHEPGSIQAVVVNQTSFDTPDVPFGCNA